MFWKKKKAKISKIKEVLSVYFRTKFHVSSIILTGFRQGVILPPNQKRITKKPTVIKVNFF